MQLITKQARLEVVLEGAEALAAVKRQITIAADNIVKITWHDERPTKVSKLAWRLPGTALPGVLYAGTFRRRGHWEFWYMSIRRRGYLEIETKSHRFRRLLLSIDKARAEKAIIWFNKRQQMRSIA